MHSIRTDIATSVMRVESLKEVAGSKIMHEVTSAEASLDVVDRRERVPNLLTIEKRTTSVLGLRILTSLNKTGVKTW